MTTVNKIEIQDHKGDIYYPHTESDIVKHENGILKDVVNNKLSLDGGTLTGMLNAPAGITGNLTGNATTSTRLQTARNINGTSFNGSANITTAQWGTARNITIGNTGKSVNGSANVSWSLGEIGASPSNHTHGVFNRNANGFVPQPGGNSATRYLREDGTWVAVIESGNNVNGVWVKYADGTMICNGRYAFGSSSYTTPIAGPAAFSSPDSAKAITFPQAFISAPFLSTNIEASAYLISQAAGVTTTACVIRTYSNYSTVANGCVITYTAIGKWK